MTRMFLLSTAILAAVVAGAPDAEARQGGPGQGMDFAALDADGDGLVTLEEFEAHRAARFDAVDADGDGQVTREEFAAHMVLRAQERAGEMFDRLDTDGDGTVSRETVEAARRGPSPERIIARLDTDGDGAVSAAEFEAARQRMAEGRGAGHSGPGRGHGERLR